MIKLLVSLLPLAVAAAITPTTWGLIVLLLNRAPNPLKTGFALLAGPILYIFFLTLIALWAADPIQDYLATGSTTSPEDHVVIIIAQFVLCFVFLVMALFAAFAKPHPGKEKRWEKYLQRLAETDPWKLFFVSLFAQIPRWKTLALFLSALTLIAASNVGPLQRLVVLLVFVAIAYSAYVVPFFFFLISPQKATDSLQKIISILGRKSVTVSLYLFLAYIFLQSALQTLY